MKLIPKEALQDQMSVLRYNVIILSTFHSRKISSHFISNKTPLRPLIPGKILQDINEISRSIKCIYNAASPLVGPLTNVV